MAQPKFRTQLPEHAVAEIKADPKQRDFWSRWQEVGDAKLDASDAAQEWTGVEREAIECRTVALTDQRPLIDGCGCGEHGQQVRNARGEFERARGEVDKSVAKFKRGNP